MENSKLKIGAKMKEGKQHTEIIKCPQCGLIQPAIVEHTFPWFSYVHHCVRCKYIITESEWEIAEFPKKEIK